MSSGNEIEPFFFDLDYESINISSFAQYEVNNTFLLFEPSFDNLIYIVFSNSQKDIICYDFTKNKIVNQIKKAHKDYITSFRYFLDIKNNRDLILSVSADEKNIKVWNINNLECLLELKEIYSKGQVYSACFLKDKDDIFIVTSHHTSFSIVSVEAIKVYDLKGNKIKELSDIRENTYNIDSFYDTKLSKNFVIRGKQSCLSSYDYTEDKRYKDYFDEDASMMHNIYIHFVINEKENVELIASHYDSNIRIWNFHSGLLIKKIRINKCFNLGGICLVNEKYLYVASKKGTIKLIDMESGNIISSLEAGNGEIINVEKINHSFYGLCLVSQNLLNSQIKLWKNRNYL